MRLFHSFLLLRASSAFNNSKNVVLHHRVVSTTAAAAKEICETTITDTGKAEVLCTISNEDDRSSLWSDVAIKAAKQFTITQRKKLQELGALDVQRPIKIVGRAVSDTCGLGDCVLTDDDDTVAAINNGSSDTKIIHFQRHGQGMSTLIVLIVHSLHRLKQYSHTLLSLSALQDIIILYATCGVN